MTQDEQMQIVNNMLETIRSNGPIERMSQKRIALSDELLSLDHSIANFLKYSDFIIEHNQVGLLLTFYRNQQANSIDNNVKPESSTTDMPTQDIPQSLSGVSKKTLSMSEAKNIVIEILSKQTKGITISEIIELLNNRGMSINKNSLKAVLTNMKKSKYIENDSGKGGWFISTYEQAL